MYECVSCAHVVDSLICIPCFCSPLFCISSEIHFSLSSDPVSKEEKNKTKIKQKRRTSQSASLAAESSQSDNQLAVHSLVKCSFVVTFPTEVCVDLVLVQSVTKIHEESTAGTASSRLKLRGGTANTRHCLSLVQSNRNEQISLANVLCCLVVQPTQGRLQEEDKRGLY